MPEPVDDRMVAVMVTEPGLDSRPAGTVANCAAGPLALSATGGMPLPVRRLQSMAVALAVASRSRRTISGSFRLCTAGQAASPLGCASPQ